MMKLILGLFAVLIVVGVISAVVLKVMKLLALVGLGAILLLAAAAYVKAKG